MHNLAHLCIWIIALTAIFGVIARPWRVPEAVWAVAGAALLVCAALLAVPDAVAAVRQGWDVYCFLTGMMLLSEVARVSGLFDWLAAVAVKRSKGSPRRLFVSIYAIGTLVTIVLSNDATAVVLTPAVYAAAQRARADALPYLFACAFIANAASFVLPISNPANLVVFGDHLPPLGAWLRQFGAASGIAIVATYGILRFLLRRELRGEIACDVRVPRLAAAGRLAAMGVGVTAVVLLVASGLQRQLGVPTLITGALVAAVVLAQQRDSPWALLRGISWSVLPLVAGLFVLVRAVEATGILNPVVAFLARGTGAASHTLTLGMGGSTAVLTNVVNNLPLGLLAGTLTQAAHLSAHGAGALLIGVDLGPNLSVTGSLATILWLVALRREGIVVSGKRFLKLGGVVMPGALLAALMVYDATAAH